MFKQVTPDIQVVNYASDICASWKRPVIYMVLDNNLWEVSLQTYTQKLIYSFSQQTVYTLACDENDQLYVRAHDGTGECVHLIPYEDSWTPVVYSNIYSMFNGQIPPKIRESYYNFCRRDSGFDFSPYSYVKDNEFFHWDGSLRKRYTLQGSISFTYLEYARWVIRDGDDVVFCLQDCLHQVQIWKTQGDHAILLWYEGPQEPRYVTYSPVKRAIYGLSPRVLDGKAYYHVSVYQHEVISLFNLCSSKINRDAMIENVPSFLKDQVINLETERYVRVKDRISRDFYCGVTTDAQLREVYNNLPM